ncbi:hypothetical protein SVAN01_08455 [Stagonosporopsis vannaccii]|nr:hypothetical protein SVAN01_08455 [Stagonosporopsis vannaccii]
MQAFLDGKHSFYACRALLGLIEGGFIPDTILFLSYFYTSAELPKRLSVFWASYQGTNIGAAFLAFGLLRLRGFHGMAGWRWLFAMEGCNTGLIGIVSWFYLPASPTQTAVKSGWNPFRGKAGWFSEHEEKIMVNRIIRDNPSKGDLHNRQSAGPWTKWALSCLLVGHPYMHAILVALGSRNAGTIRTRTVASSFYNMSVQMSSIIASNIYRNDDKPLYGRGNRVLIGICVYNTSVFAGAKLFYLRVNKKRNTA